MMLSVKTLISSRCRPLVAVALTLMVAAFASAPSADAKQSTYRSPHDAVEALVEAVRGGNTDAIVAILGPEGRELASSGDPVADAAARERFLAAYDEQHRLQQSTDTRALLVIGSHDFPFPIPLIQSGDAWAFDTVAGKDEILDRRVGENEFSAIEVMRAYVDAQEEYAEADRDGRGPQYARRLLSNDGKQDGLYWPVADGEAVSPLGPLVAEAQAEGYRRRGDSPPPYHGYLFRVLYGQGKNAAGGPRDYIIAGRMIGGFGLVAAPAEYGNSGVMTFIVNQDGDIFQKDLGPETGRIAAEMRIFNPDETWTKVPASDQ